MPLRTAPERRPAAAFARPGSPATGLRRHRREGGGSAGRGQPRFCPVRARRFSHRLSAGEPARRRRHRCAPPRRAAHGALGSDSAAAVGALRSCSPRRAPQRCSRAFQAAAALRLIHARRRHGTWLAGSTSAPWSAASRRPHLHRSSESLAKPRVRCEFEDAILLRGHALGGERCLDGRPQPRSAPGAC